MFFQLDEVTKNKKNLSCFHSLIIRIYIYMTTWDEKPRPCPECRSAHGFLILQTSDFIAHIRKTGDQVERETRTNINIVCNILS